MQTRCESIIRTGPDVVGARFGFEAARYYGFLLKTPHESHYLREASAILRGPLEVFQFQELFGMGRGGSR